MNMFAIPLPQLTQYNDILCLQRAVAILEANGVHAALIWRENQWQLVGDEKPVIERK